MKEVVIASACRTAIGTFGGTLKDSHAATIGSVAMKAAVERSGIDPAIIDDVRFGCCMEPVDSLNVTRIASPLCWPASLIRLPQSPSTGCVYQEWRRLFPAWL
jgi:acetyl-CoA C-acetyltransferase